MPIDTPYNRMVTNQYNDIIRNKVNHEMDTLQTVVSSPAGMYNTGYEPKTVGSGVGLYKKNKSCPKGHAVCKCDGAGYARGDGFARGAGFARGGNNLGLQPAVRTELALGAGLRGDATCKHGCLNDHEMMAHGGFNPRFNARVGLGNARGGFGVQDLLGLLGMGAEEGHIEGGFLSDLLSKFGLGNARGAGNARGELKCSSRYRWG